METIKTQNKMSSYYGLVSGGGNAAANIFSGFFSNFLGQEREDYARIQNHMINEAAADNADKRTRALYNDLYSPQAQMSQIKKAGISPSVFYGDMAGISGQTGAQGSGATGVSPTTYGINPVDMANINLMNAQAEKLKAETETEQGVNERGKNEISKLIESINNVKLQNEFKEWENSIEAINLNLLATFGEDKARAEIDNIMSQTNNLKESLRKLRIDGNISEATEKDVIKYMREKVINQQADTYLKQEQGNLAKANVHLSNVQAEQLFNKIFQDWEVVDISRRKLYLDREKLDKQVEQWCIENNLRERGQNIEIAKSVANYIQESRANFVRLLDAIVPF